MTEDEKAEFYARGASGGGKSGKSGIVNMHFDANGEPSAPRPDLKPGWLLKDIRKCAAMMGLNMSDPRPPFPLVDWPEIPSRDYHNEIKTELDQLRKEYSDILTSWAEIREERGALREALKVAREALEKARPYAVMQLQGSTAYVAQETIGDIDAAIAQIDRLIGGDSDTAR